MTIYFSARALRMDVLCDELHAFGLASQGGSTVAPIHFGGWTQTDYMKCLRELVKRGGVQRNGTSGIKPREMLTFVPIPQGDLFGSGVG